MRTDIKRTMEQARMEMDILSKVYSKVRLLSRDELCVDNSDDACWRESCLGGGEYCEDCVSVMSIKEHRQKTKLKYIGSELYEVTARYLEIDGKPYSEVVAIARQYIKQVGGFEKFAEWGLF